MLRFTSTGVLCIICLVLSIDTNGAQDVLTNSASEFFLAFSKNHRFGYYDTLTMVISTTESSPVGFEIYSPYGYSYSDTVYPPSTYQFTLAYYLTVDSIYDRNKGISVKTTLPSQSITVSAMNYEEYTADAFLALPKGPMLQEYRYIISSVLWNNRTGSNFPSLMLLVGTEDNTAVTITPTQYVTIPSDLRDVNDPRTIIHPGQSYTVILNKLNTYQIENSLDLTGSQVVSNKPLSVFAGHECADVPEGVTACDHLFEQVPATSTWGRFFFLVSSDSTDRTSSEWYRIVSSKQSTTVTITCYSLEDSLHSFTYHAYIAAVGGFEEFLVERDNYCYVESDKPVLVMQYAYGGSANSGWGDPLMMMILPTEQYVTNTTIQFWAYYNFVSDITIVVLQQDYPSNILLDGTTLNQYNWNAIYCSEEELCGYTLRLPVTAGSHSIRHLNSSVPVAVYVYGFEYYQGYGYPAALSLKNLELLECADGGVRLVDGGSTTEGRVEVCLGGQWGTVCTDLWTPEDTDVVCGQLGLLSTGLTTSSFGAGQGPILLDNVECLGAESTILECPYDTHTSDCTHYQDAGVVCLPYPNPTTTIQRDSNTSQLFAGYDLVLSCSISINLNLTDRVIPAASWFKDGIEYSFNWDSHISVSPITLSADGVYITTLSFMPLNLGDSGHYQCVSTLTGFTGTTLANATDSTTLTVEGLPQTLIQLQLYGVQNCYEWMVSNQDTGISEQLATVVSDGVEDLCQCGFSANNIDQTIMQCFPDNQEKINILLLLRPTPRKNTSEILNFVRAWMTGNPQITFNENNTVLHIDSDCDIEKFQGSECNIPTVTESTSTPTPATNSTSTPTSATTNTSTTSTTPTRSTNANVADSGSNGQDVAIAGGVLIALAITVVIVMVVLAIVMRYRSRVNFFRLNEPLSKIRILYQKATARKETKEDKRELVEDDGNDIESHTVVVVDPPQ